MKVQNLRYPRSSLLPFASTLDQFRWHVWCNFFFWTAMIYLTFYKRYKHWFYDTDQCHFDIIHVTKCSIDTVHHFLMRLFQSSISMPPATIGFHCLSTWQESWVKSRLQNHEWIRPLAPVALRLIAQAIPRWQPVEPVYNKFIIGFL